MGWHEERKRQRIEDQSKADVAADIEKLTELRWYVMLNRRVKEVDDIAAIEEHAERLTG
jgi:hypothetical protein